MLISLKVDSRTPMIEGVENSTLYNGSGHDVYSIVRMRGKCHVYCSELLQATRRVKEHMLMDHRQQLEDVAEVRLTSPRGRIIV